MRKTAVFFLTIIMLLTSCAPAYNIPPSTPDVSGRFRSSAQALSSAFSHNSEPDPLFSTLEYTYDDIEDLSPAPPLEYEFLPAGELWLNLASGETPVSFSATYELADNVLVVNKEVTESIASAGQLMTGGSGQKPLPGSIIAEGGYVPRAVLDAAAQKMAFEVENGTVVVDESSGTAFKVVAPTEFTGVFDTDAELRAAVQPLKDTYAVAQPELHEVLKDFSFGGAEGETVTLTRANITEFASNVEKNLALPTGYSYTDTYKGFRNLSDDPLMKLSFKNERLDARLGSGSPISVIVSGGLGVEKIDVTARYSAFDGYRLTMTLSQESYLVIEMEAEIAEEIVIPVFGVHVAVKAGDKEIARIAGGVFVIVGMDGTLKLEVEAREFSSTTAGVRGSTKFYVPTSIHTVYDPHFESDGDVNLSGDIDGYMKFGPMLKLDVFGFKLVGAGVLLGVGVNVQTDGYFLNVELYGLLQVYIDFLGKHLSLANYRPTIMTKRQTDTAGFQVTFLEAYVYPGRVGGILKKDPPGKGQPYVVAPDIQYRILVVPEGETFDPNKAGDIDKPTIRKYPEKDYALTNAEGEFIQMDENILFGGDLACLEIRVGDKSYFSAFVSPTLPFEKVVITEADYFNDFVKGQVQPVRVINWFAEPDDPPYEWVYYANGLITLNPYLSTTWNIHIPYGGQARTLTDAKGRFDTRNTLMSSVPSIPLQDQYFDVYENPPDHGMSGGFDFRLDYNKASEGDNIPFKTTSPLLFTRMVVEVPGSYERYEEGGKLVDRMAYDEYIWIVNPHGTRTVTEAEFGYRGGMFSTQDYVWEINDNTAFWYDIAFTPNSDTPRVDSNGYPVFGECKLTPVPDENGEPTGTALFSQRVTVEWVWQEYPKPVKITSDDHTTVTTDGGSFQVTAEGIAPFKFSLTGAPQGVAFKTNSFGVNSGLMTIPAGLAAGEYKFTIRASEDRTLALANHLPGGSDIYEGNDPPPPDEQVFTLLIIEASQTPGDPQPPETSQLPDNPQPPEESQPPEEFQPPEPDRTAPDISVARHGYRFTMTAGVDDLSVVISAAGSEPITWSLASSGGRRIPAEISIDAKSGLLTAKRSIAPGTYTFTIRAENDVGSDTQECVITVAEARTAPEIEEAEHGYALVKLTGGGDLVVPVTAVGSQPIYWSLEQKSERYIMPEEVTIDPDTGVLTVKEGIEPGNYFFIIRAENDVGIDTQECELKVMSLSLPSMRPGLSVPAGSSGQIVYLSSPSGEAAQAAVQMLSQATQTPPNSVTLRWEDDKDIYTRDRFTVNGALYVRWHAFPKVHVRGSQPFNYYGDYWGAVAGQNFYDTSPRCDNYHHRADPLPKAILDKLLQALKKQTTEVSGVDVLISGIPGADTLLTDLNNYSVNQIEDGFCYLEYGSLIDNMAAQKGGTFQVELNDGTGTIVTGKYFVGLQNNKTAQLSFIQEGARVIFSGADIKTASEYDMLDFGYYAGAFNEQQMLSAAGSGAESFTYAFAYHGELPGTATFEIPTGIAEGTMVNVYKYDAGTKRFTLIAGNVAVGAGGIVTYRNNTMSEYLITTATIEGASVSDMAGRQVIESNDRWLPITVIGTAVVCAAAAAAILFLRKNRRRAQ